MVRLDRIKTVSPLTLSVNDFNPEYFTNNSNSEGKEQTWTLDSRHLDHDPYKVYIKFNFVSNELVLEVSSKVLQVRYPEGITYSNFSQVLNNISNHVDINRDGYMRWADVTSVDIRQDVPIALTKSDYNQYPLYLKYPAKFHCKTYDSGIHINTDYKTKSRNYHLKFYDKEKEIQLAKNEPFLSGLYDADKIVNAFAGKTRVELELKSKYLLRKYFDIHDLSIDSILRNRGDPIKKVCQEIFDLTTDIKPLTNISSIAEYKQYLLVKDGKTGNTDHPIPE